ncbi:hypothetical protein L6452_15162 [Arctium lappa]|uniref:Uncharacterized protein n=1 Tax=Arctium lappa TaxID=4217 RepID=A0ACB9CMZ2_ARCLA|nr:hypothetical protein L6452_15162 [Arctium lappa]
MVSSTDFIPFFNSRSLLPLESLTASFEFDDDHQVHSTAGLPLQVQRWSASPTLSSPSSLASLVTGPPSIPPPHHLSATVSLQLQSRTRICVNLWFFLLLSPVNHHRRPPYCNHTTYQLNGKIAKIEEKEVLIPIMMF